MTDLVRELEQSARVGYLLGNHDEPLNDYGKRIVRVIAQALSAQQPVANDEAVATLLMCAWTEYVALFGAQPHGTFKQLNALLALQGAGRKIAALYASPPPAQQQGPTEAEIELARDIIEIAGNEERIEVELARAVLRMAGKP